MRKEVVLAIVAGISIGLIIAFGAWKLTQSLKKDRIILDTNRNVPIPKTISLGVSNLSDFDVITSNPFTISGITNPKSEIVVSTTEADFYGHANEDGSFDIEVKLPAGLSEIMINSQKLKVVYSGEFAKYLPENTEVNVEGEATTSSDTIDSTDIVREKVKEEIATKSLKTTAFVGTITDISSGTIQIKSIQGDIKQMSLSDDTSYVNTLKKNISIKSTDLAIGDYIVAMGFINGNKVLNAKRILISEPLTPNKFEAISGVVKEASKTKLVISKEDNETLEITLPKKWTGPNMKDLEIGQKVIVVGEMKDETFDLRTIFVVQ